MILKTTTTKRISLNDTFQKKWSLISKIDEKYFKNCLGDLQSTSIYRTIDNNFSYEDIKNEWEKKIKIIKNDPSKKKDQISLYIHIPFCIKKCNFCCYTANTYNKEEVQKYISNIVFEANYFKETFKDFKFQALYLGGGTPNILDEEKLETLLNTIFNCFNFEKECEKKIECNPAFLTEKKIKTLKSFNFNNISFGVQSLDLDVLKSANREYQTRDFVINALNLSKQNDIKNINVDLMIGLKKDNSTKFLSSLKDLLTLKPNTITLYKISPIKDYLQEKNTLNNKTAYLDSIYDIQALFKGIKTECQKHHYEYNENEFNLKESGMSITLKQIKNEDNKLQSNTKQKKYDFSTNSPSSCLGLGLFSQTHIYENILCKNNNTNFEKNTTNKIYTRNYTNLKLEILSVLINHYYFFENFDVEILSKHLKLDFKTYFKKKLFMLKEFEKIIIKQDKIFLQDTNDLVKFALFLLDSSDIKKLIIQKKELKYNEI